MPELSLDSRVGTPLKNVRDSVCQLGMLAQPALRENTFIPADNTAQWLSTGTLRADPIFEHAPEDFSRG